MRLIIFRDFPAFVQDWYQAESRLTPLHQDVLHSVAINGETLTSIGARRGFTREMARTHARKAIAKFTEHASSRRSSPLLKAIRNGQRAVDVAGLERAFSLAASPDRARRDLTDQLLNLHAITPEQAQWAAAVIRLLPEAKPKRPQLHNLLRDTRQIAGRHHHGASPNHLIGHLDDWRPTLAHWPGFDLTAHIQALIGLTPDPKTGLYHPVRGWNSRIHSDPTLAVHFAAAALIEAGKPLKARDAVVRANEIARRECAGRTYSTYQITAALQTRPEFKWAGPSTYGLDSWDIGYSAEGPTPDGRAKIADEIIHLLRCSRAPVPISTIRDHILARYHVTPTAIDNALKTNKSSSSFIIHPDRTVSLNPQDPDPPSI